MTYDKTIEANEQAAHPDYPSVFSIWGTNHQDEANRFADLVHFLKENKATKRQKVLKKLTILYIRSTTQFLIYTNLLNVRMKS